MSDAKYKRVFLKSLPPNAVSFFDNFWRPRIATNSKVTMFQEYELLKSTGRLGVFSRNGKTHQFWDSDTAKWLEAASYVLATDPNQKLQKRVDAVARMYVRAQQPDGYLNSFFQRTAPDKRWTNLRDMHELYCAGHLMEAAVARYEYCGKRDLIETLCRYADHIGTVFGPGKGQKRGYPGHPEIELALVALYRVTGRKAYLNLAAFFINERGKWPYFYDIEARERGEQIKPGKPGKAYDQYQAHLPLRRQKTAEGHAVRACYLFAGMADVAMETGDLALKSACRSLWNNITTRRMYVTGGIGSSPASERFTVDYDLPDEGAYAETCAAIALVFFAKRMLNMELNSKYADVLETALYNGVASGVSLDGKRFFYANRLAVYPALQKRVAGTHQHHPHRQPWFGTSCCPTNIARLFPSLGSYIASFGPDRVALHFYAAAVIDAPLEGGRVRLAIKGDYPWQGAIAITVTPEQSRSFIIALRLPGWCRRPVLRINGKLVSTAAITKSGYVHLKRCWRPGDRVELELPMDAQRIEAHPSVRQAAGQIALRRGPIVYCLEECDNGPDLADIILPRNARVTAHAASMLGKCVVLKGSALRRSRDGWSNRLYQSTRSARKPFNFQAVPYCLWDNREKGEMRVWLKEI